MAAGGRKEAWRWRATALTPQRTIHVIEPPADDERRRREGRKVPFGFGPRDESEIASVPVEPLLWDGDGA